MSSGANEAKKVPRVIPSLVLVVAGLVAVQALLIVCHGVFSVSRALGFAGENSGAFLAFHLAQCGFGVALGFVAWALTRRVRAVWTPLLIVELMAVLIALPDLLYLQTAPGALAVVVPALVAGGLLVVPSVRVWVRGEDEQLM